MGTDKAVANRCREVIVGEFSPRSILLMALMDNPHRSASALKDQPCRSRKVRKRTPTFGVISFDMAFSLALVSILIFD
jgi:hypothetical protein